MGRFFTKQQKRAGNIFFGVEGEADHIKPYSKGGATDVSNMQIIPSHINKMKSAFEFEPREWQKEFFADYKTNQAENFLLIAIPGSGKTFAALEIARQWLRQAQNSCVVVVVPSDNLRQQWRSEAVNFGINLQTEEFGTDFKKDFHGGVVTYAGVSKNPEMYKIIIANKRTLVIFDEVHHACETASYGRSINEAFWKADKRLCMSGTPWNSNGRIPFIEYDENGFAKPHYEYNYTQARRDNVVRYLIFDYGKGKLTDIESGEEHELNKDTNKSDSAWRLNRLLDHRGDFVKKLLTEADNKLDDVRQIMPDAGGLVVCIDITHAENISEVLKEITGETPSVIVSDNLKTNDDVRSFRKSKKKWIVSVGMISEGTDIKRLQVLAYLSNVTTALNFRQVVGRVSRTRNQEDFDGYVFLPSDPRLIELAQEMENMQIEALKDPKESIERDPTKPSDKTFPMFETDHCGTDSYHINGQIIELQEAERIKNFAKKHKTSESIVHALIQEFGFNTQAQTTETQTQKAESHDNVSLEEELKKWRKLCNKVVNKIVGPGKHQDQYRAVHASYGMPQNQMTLDQLKAKYKSLEARYESNKRSKW